MGREASARQASAPRRSSGNRFRGSFRRRKSKQTRLNLAGEAGGANKKRRTGDDSSYALSLPIPSHPPCFRLDLFACPSLFHHRTTPYCSRCSRPIIHPGATTGYPILARVAAVPRLASCHPSISVIIFMLSAPQPSSPPHNISPLPFFAYPPPSRPYSISKITKQFLPGIRETSNPDGSRVFIPRNFLVYTDSCRASLSLSPSLPLSPV